ncbi:MAG: hypothetical protein WCJ35_06325 [Planctomycetota bacterium]
MFQQASTAALMALAALTTCGAGVSPAHAAETAAPQKAKEAGGNKQIAVDLGGGVKLKLTLIPAGEFKMGGEESAEATAAFFNKTYGEDYVQADLLKDEHPQQSRNCESEARPPPTFWNSRFGRPPDPAISRA